jgi:SAM-dependent methyltransferase
MQPQAARFPFRSKPEKRKRQRRRVLTGEPGPSRCAILDQGRRHEGRPLGKFNGRVQVVVSDFDHLELAYEHFDAIYAFESIGYTKDLDCWLARCWRSLKAGGRLLIRSPGSLDAYRREHDYRSVTAFFENWRYNFLGANLLVFKPRRLGFDPIRYRQLARATTMSGD